MIDRSRMQPAVYTMNASAVDSEFIANRAQWKDSIAPTTTESKSDAAKSSHSEVTSAPKISVIASSMPQKTYNEWLGGAKGGILFV